jgi:hypothetical protein
MLTGQAGRVFVLLCICLATPAAALAATLCATDNFSNTIVLNADSDFAAGAIVGLHGWLSIGMVTIPLHGTAVVDSAGEGVKIAVQGINNTRHQHVGIAVDTDLMLSGNGTFENVNPGRPFTYDIIAVIWTALDPCPDTPPF